MKSCIKRVAGVIVGIALILGFVSCANEPETKIEYVEKTYCSPVIFSSEDLGNDGVRVTMETATEGAVIHYTTNGSTPTESSPVYTAPVTFINDVILKAIAVKYGIENSPVSVATVSIVEKTIEVEKTVEVIKYVCSKCKEEYTTAEEAADCCGVQTVEKEVTVYKYVCPEDKKEYTTAQEAAECCGVQIEYVDKEIEKIVKKYVCPRDGNEYDTAEEAAECCGPIVNTVIKYVCPKCKETYDSAQEAADCCGVQTVEKEVTVYKYVCPKDKREYTTAQEAAECCGVQIEYVDKEVEKIVKKYVCPRDGNEYDTAEEAEECCGPVEVEKLVYTTAVKVGTYTVYHLQQKITGGKAVSDYVLESTENNKTVAENTTLEDLKETYAGFTAKAMAQNETAIYVFYDRNTITYTFQTGTEGKFDDGKTEKTVSGLYGASYTKPKATTSGDYNFVKWQDSSENVASSTFGAEDRIWTAVWKLKPDYSKCVVGDFILRDGTILSKDETPEIGTVAAVIVSAATYKKPALGVGIVHSKGNLAWCTSSAVGYNTNITALQGNKTSGYMNGSDGWEKLKDACSDALDNPEYYPVWNYTLTYGEKNGLEGTLAEGWYLPTIAELYTVCQNKATIDASLSRAGGRQFGSDRYWSCCQNSSVNYYAYYLEFTSDNGYPSSYDKSGFGFYVCTVRAFY